jgi:hypothetical protein
LEGAGVYGHRYRDKKVVGVFVRFRAPLQKNDWLNEFTVTHP